MLHPTPNTLRLYFVLKSRLTSWRVRKPYLNTMEHSIVRGFHFPCSACFHQIRKIMAVTAKIRKRKFGFYYKLPLFVRSWLLFIYNYIFRLGFLDGKEGFIYNYMYHRWYRTLVDSKIYEQMKFPKEFEKTGALK